MQTYGSDHQLLIANIRLNLIARKRHTVSKRYDRKKLSDPIVAVDYQTKVAENLMLIIDKLAGDTENCINDEKMVGAFNDTSQIVFGTVQSMPAKDWLSEDTWCKSAGI